MAGVVHHIESPDRVDDTVRIPIASTGPHAFAQLGLEITVSERSIPATTRRHYGLAEDITGRQAQDHARGTVGHPAVELRPHFLPQLRDVGTKHALVCEFGNAGRA